jgi:hypothetical protein
MLYSFSHRYLAYKIRLAFHEYHFVPVIHMFRGQLFCPAISNTIGCRGLFHEGHSMKITWRLHTWPIFPPFWGTASLACDSLRIAKYNFNGKFAVTTFKSRFSRCLNCLESFTRVDSTPKMADLGLWASYTVG